MVEDIPGLFEKSASRKAKEAAVATDERYKQIGQLKVECDFGTQARSLNPEKRAMACSRPRTAEVGQVDYGEERLLIMNAKLILHSLRLSPPGFPRARDKDSYPPSRPIAASQPLMLPWL